MASETFNLVDAGVRDLKRALDAGAITSVQLLAMYLQRIAKYDCNGPSLNSIPLLNPKVFEEAQASDDYRASGQKPRPLEGIPFTVKDSFKVKGMTVAAGSPAFAGLNSTDDAMIVSCLRKAGAIVLGKTNMPAMADGGGQRGLYGKSESPYNPEYSTTAYASGSSNGAGTSTTASFAAFGFGGETVSSGRSPASNNALIGYSPSRGVIPLQGQWPLYPTCDVIVPLARSVKDLVEILNVIVVDDPNPAGDFWRGQSACPIPLPSQIRPADYQSLEDPHSLQGKKIAVPMRYIGKQSPTALKAPDALADSVHDLWLKARTTLESLGATVVETDLPLVDNYEKKLYPGQSANVPGMPADWMNIERCRMIATGWDDFLRANGDKSYPNFTVANPDIIHPHVAPMDDPTMHTEVENHVRYVDMIETVRHRHGTVYDLPGCVDAIKALEEMRKRDLEDWMDSNGFDVVVFPTNGDVARADSEELHESMLHALQEGIKYANGGRGLKHLGVPAITVPMGNMADKEMPVGLTFLGKAYSDNDLIRYAYAFEQGRKGRVTPPRTPALPSDVITLPPPSFDSSSELRTVRPVLKVGSFSTTPLDAQGPDTEARRISITGTFESTEPKVKAESMTIYVNGEQTTVPVSLTGNSWKWESNVTKTKKADKYPTLHKVPKDQFLIIVVAKASNGRSAGWFSLFD
jgi:Asp-tRNA(Asn)/Glu-tRNA(Gln) amidotransferase A subunit family amidase